VSHPAPPAVPPEWPRNLAALILSPIRIRHPPVLDPHLEPDPAWKAAGWLAIVMFVLGFTPVPFDL